MKDFIQEEVEKIPETESVEKEIEDTLPEEPKKEEFSPPKIIGGILIAFGVADFGLSWFGINLTPFLPPEIARFSPIAFMLVGGAIMSAGGDSESDAYDAQRTEKSGVELAEEAERKKKIKKK